MTKKSENSVASLGGATNSSRTQRILDSALNTAFECEIFKNRNAELHSQNNSYRAFYDFLNPSNVESKEHY